MRWLKKADAKLKQVAVQVHESPGDPAELRRFLHGVEDDYKEGIVCPVMLGTVELKMFPHSVKVWGAREDSSGKVSYVGAC